MSASTPARRVHVLYTGGTIGMVQSPDGLRPASDFEHSLRAVLARHPAPLPACTFTELSPPIDSANLTPVHWQAMHTALIRAAESGESDAVLILHGTDTLAYTAAYLAHLLIGYPLPVLLTGAMHPANTEDSDAWPNVLGALAALNRPAQRGVGLHFHGHTLDAVTVTKWHGSAKDAFRPAPRPPLETHADAADLRALPDWRTPRRTVALAALPFVPGLPAAALEAVLESGIDALLLECYGSGTGPADNPAILAALRRAHVRGTFLAAITQCPAGAMQPGIYAASSQLAATGVISAGALTREAALARLHTLLGANLPHATIARLLSVAWETTRGVAN